MLAANHDLLVQNNGPRRCGRHYCDGPTALHLNQAAVTPLPQGPVSI